MAETRISTDAALEDPSVRALWEVLSRERAALRSEVLTTRESLRMRRQAILGQSQRENVWTEGDNRSRKAGLYSLWKQSTVLGSAAEVIAKRFVSGTWRVVPRTNMITGKALVTIPAGRLLLLDYLSYCNDTEDFKQILYKTILDLIVFGESYHEIVYRSGIPYELYSCNTVAMDYVADGFGGVKYYTYKGSEASARPKRIACDLIERIWLPDIADVQRGFSPVEGMVDPLYSDRMMVRTQHNTFANMGSAAQVIYTLPSASNETEARALQTYIDEQYSGALNAGRERVLYGGTTASALALRGIDADFLRGRDEARSEALGRLHVPPAMVSLIESGNIGGGTGESQERSFLQNVLEFLRGLVCEKITYNIFVKRFGVTDWVLDITFADVVGDPYVESCKTINEKRLERGLPPVPDGNIPIIIVENHGVKPEIEPPGAQAPPAPAPQRSIKGAPARAGKENKT